MKLESPHLAKNQFALPVFLFSCFLFLVWLLRFGPAPRRAKEDAILPVLFKAIMAKVLWEKEFARKLERRSRPQII